MENPYVFASESEDEGSTPPMDWEDTSYRTIGQCASHWDRRRIDIVDKGKAKEYSSNKLSAAS